MRKTKIVFSFLILMFFTSCSNNEIDDFREQSNKQQSRMFSFDYKGGHYFSSYNLTEDSIMVLNDPDVNSLYQRLLELPELVTYVKGIDKVEFFDNSDQITDTVTNNKPSLRSTISYTSFILKLYEGEGFKGKVKIVESRVDEVSGSYQYISSDLSYVDFDNILSSFSLNLVTNGRNPSTPSGISYKKGAAKLYLHENDLSTGGGKVVIFDMFDNTWLTCSTLKAYSLDNKVSAVRVLCW